jgi:hypothetical protein
MLLIWAAKIVLEDAAGIGADLTMRVREGRFASRTVFAYDD